MPSKFSIQHFFMLESCFWMSWAFVSWDAQNCFGCLTLKSGLQQVCEDQVEADNVDFEGDDEGRSALWFGLVISSLAGLDLRIEAPEERSERPGWKRMKWQALASQIQAEHR